MIVCNNCGFRLTRKAVTCPKCNKKITLSREEIEERRENIKRSLLKRSYEDAIENYEILAESGKDFVTRIPLIPGYTDRVENISAIAAFMQTNGVSYAELLPYNSLADAKYGALLRAYELEKFENTDLDIVCSIFAKFGIHTRMM